MSIVVATCIVQSWDYLRPPSSIDPQALYICFTDRPIERVPTWEIQPAYTPCGMPASRASRLPKLLPHLHFGADYSIWHDANFVLRVSPQELIDTFLCEHDIAMFDHPCRHDVGQEVAVLLNEHIGDPTEVKAQQTTWLHMGAPVGLWAGGLIIRRHSKAVRQFNETWWHYFKNGSTRDQIALPMAKHETGIEIQTIPGDIYSSPLMGFHWHAAWLDKEDNSKYRSEIAPYQMRRKRLEELAR